MGASVFATTLVLLNLASTLYHALPGPRAKRVLRILDHSATYFLIAGTYTPFTRGVLHGPWGWTLFGLVWGMAIAGTVMKALDGLRSTAASTWMNPAVGWLILIAAEPAWTLLPKWGLVWLFAGGVAYTLGAVFLWRNASGTFTSSDTCSWQWAPPATSSRCCGTRPDKAMPITPL